MSTMKPLLTVKQVSVLLSCELSNTYNLISSGKLPSVRTGANGGGIKVAEEDLAEFIEGSRKGRRIAPWPEKTKPVQLRHLH